ncbi:hypothetical protein BDM02DRAFT_3115651 [Thelephora ganbajun]|uniref:Uncharacterized protein n=1 Tax=Thelephora ganbajun TaxID=370292 RepID=A0ACB6ZFT8_THEGA|nr:hypothetical protein BDM02DRAFT_3115651 [Thelephora ganbajun]
MGPRKWRDELYPIYENYLGPHVVKNPKLSSPHSEGLDANVHVAGETNHVFDIERSAAALFGLVTYGVHMTVYEKDDDGTIRLWTPTRAKTKQTWPGYLDNSVAGGTPSGVGMFESLVKESMEEASLEEDLVRKHARAVGVVSYFFRTDTGWLQPEVEFVYDLLVPRGEDLAPFQPKPQDGEVEKFELLPLDEVVKRMKAGLFKPNCAVVIIDFMIRHGFITPDNEGDFLDINTRIHRRFDFETYIPR